MKHLTTFRLIDVIVRSGSIRAAAEIVSQTPSAVQRRLQAYEDDLGEQIFERTATGVRLNAAGEMAILHIREVLAETERLKSRLADLSGIRRGHVAIACSQALTPHFLPREIAAYLHDYPDVTFNVEVMEHTAAAAAINTFSTDIALVFDERSMPDYDVRLALPQRLVAMMAADHPLASEPVLRLRQCVAYPLILPNRGFGGRALLERALQGKSFQAVPMLQSNSFEYLKAHVSMTDAISFQISIGAPGGHDGATGLVSRSIDMRDMDAGMLFLGQRHGRILPVAASRFAEQIARSLSVLADT
ncbi:LysR family transcriptional regulator [Roseisalinus antarcticus]|uniref:HTH-type transcriptional activator CmpR n=1 Tax=Roseisalinus antarcticus TaxID=254357 RepID=A0A1Y5RH60_9RHOB|nr:LysR family transcriptional regulator [Roseisalinus antarcticus]SLN14751.1 HTH-type transcriptional activator CmpR [Roseisalinus antarcticus]